MKRLPRPRKRPRQVVQARPGPGDRGQKIGALWARGWRPAAALVVVAGLGWLAYYLYQAPYFRVSEVVVKGAQRVNDAQVVSAADVEGRSVVNLGTTGVAERIGALPLVKSARVSVVFPNRVEIVVEERRPWAIWQSGAARNVIDDEGVVISTIPGRTDNLITVTETQTRTLKLGDRVDVEAVRLAQKLAQDVPPRLGVTPRRFEYSPGAGVTVVTDKGVQIRFGDGDDMERQLATGRAILAMANDTKRKVNLLDLRFGDRPYFR